ncbi:hypothetical protein [Mesorhizobium sp. B2-1-5]|uniref:hypothetical protein n=1 Tax=Mesorhizobium sp. B2-1-5 TaxID=2589969 RepID=UPI001FEDECB3|nr:hypothetical protein [Mesorhizobium sp. B2-1-5]
MIMKRTDGSGSNDNVSTGVPASFPFDRTTVERFRKSFPRARWSDQLKAWFVPGKTAARRVNRWMEQEVAGSSVHADSRGRDAYAFDPIVSKYLFVHQDRLEVQTPYSRSVVKVMRDVPFASWDPDRHAWKVPYRSYEQLHRRWAEIEAAALRNEPEARKQRAAQRQGSPQELASRAHATERRRRRYPLDPNDLPPLGRPVMTRGYGVIVFIGCDGEPVDGDILGTQYADFPDHHDYVWGRWRPAALDELIKTWPSRTKTEIGDALWWQPTLDDLRIARKAARGLERRRGRV